MSRRTFTREEMFDALEEPTVEEVSSRPWRHGRHVTYVFPNGGKHWRIEVAVHHDEGVRLDGGSFEAQEVRAVQKTVTAWEAVS